MAIEVTERPLITFALFAYNQERFVREAVEGAFSQTYSPLEIILSDDSSVDSTYDTMCELAANYRGKHKVVLNRNPQNLGIPCHVNRVMQIASGQLIVAAAGDDISLPQRVELAFNVWSKTSFRADSVAMGIEPFRDNFDGNLRKASEVLTDISEVIWNAGPRVVGAAHAWSRRLFEVFGPLPEWLHQEDVIIPFRALFMGGIAFDPAPVVRYRQHPNNTLSGADPAFKGLRGQETRYKLKLQRSLRALEGMAHTVDQAVKLGLISPGDQDRLHDLIRKSVQRRKIELDLSSPNFRERLTASLMLWRIKTVRNYSIARKLFLFAAALLPSLRSLEWLLRDVDKQLLSPRTRF